ncbi:hypothetical protein H0264_14520 [Nocardia huaxiensis]|uniref:DUF3040 family protein n=1 Tax=Nocardia huaxiensis TaxID=2755382 RepID=A0A7D6VFJ8_9NOCA|nr:hypothetical protein [Nocardia huaxiensis]QLY33282.1 hypothetical protein H0264_14520 [Nocardia huaxiensis]
MSPERDFGAHDDQPDDPDDQEDDHSMMPQPEPDDEPLALEASQQSPDRFDVDTPSVGELYAMFPDALPKNHPDRRRRHLAAVPNSADLALSPDECEDTLDPLVATALRLRLALAFWWRPGATAAAVVVIAVCAFTFAGAIVGLAWCVYGTGWVAHGVWHAHGRPSLRQLYHRRHDSA